jgi:catechol 2,3-dioxygenase
MTPGDATPSAGRPYGIAPPGYRLPDGTHIGGVHLQIADLDRSIAYYEHVLGLHVQDRRDGAARLGPHGSDLTLVHLRERPGARPAPRRGAYGLYHFAILLPDRPSLGRFATHAAGQGARMGMADHLVSEALYLTDPDGLGIEVYADRPRSTWRQQGRELAMATDPLDLEGVMAAGRGRDWDGMPAGTVMGHVHLHVGDLDQADAFYHGALGFDRIVWSYPGALFLSAGGYHHHLGTNTWSPGPSAAEDDARLLEWELVVPDATDAVAAAGSLSAAGYGVTDTDEGWTTADPWGTTLRIRPDRR